jgi:hypothetical protein
VPTRDGNRFLSLRLEVELAAVASRSPRASACGPYREAIRQTASFW